VYKRQNIYNPKNYIKSDKKVYFNKLTFLQQFVKYQNSLAKKPNDVLLNFYIANAYYSLSQNGCFWYLSSPYHFSTEDYTVSNSYFLNLSAKYYYRILKISKNKKYRNASYLALNFMLDSKSLDKKNLDKLSREFEYESCETYVKFLKSLAHKFKASKNINAHKITLHHFKNF
jgi:hypothetical protein